jgi:UDP-N-acetylmuramate--alanine ligase
MITSIDNFQDVFFIGVAGSGMSALAQYLKGIGKNVSGSDRYFTAGVFNEIKTKLEAEGIFCFEQNGDGITASTQLVVASTAVEDTVLEVMKAKQMNIPIIKRSELLALIAASKKTIAIGGTSGKSTTVAMLFEIAEYAGLQPGLISGAGLTRLIRQNKIGNAAVGKGEWLIIEADESDGSIVQYKPEIGVLLNVDKDHKDMDELMQLFGRFRQNSKIFIVNESDKNAATFSQNSQLDFSSGADSDAGFVLKDFEQKGFMVSFYVQQTKFTMNVLGRHNAANALAAMAVAAYLGVDLATCAAALQQYQGIYRRHQVIGAKAGLTLIDDFAHNPAKCAASIRACQPVAKKLIAWFQPHGYAPTKFLRADFVKEIAASLRPEDEIWMSEIFYAGGTTTKDISAGDLIHDLKALHANAYFIAQRNDFVAAVKPHLTDDCVILLMGARDPTLEAFAQFVWGELGSGFNEG